MIVDAHLHIGFNGISTSSVINYLDRNRIDCCWLLTWEEKYPAHPGYRPLPVAEVFEAYQKYPSRVIPMYAPDAANGSLESTMAFWHRLGIRGIGEVKVTASWYSTEVTALLDVARKLRLPLVFHMEDPRSIYWPATNSAADKAACKLLNRFKKSRLGEETLEYIAQNSALARAILDSRNHFIPAYLPECSGLEGRLQAYPEVTFIGHGPLFWKGISADMGLELHPKGPVEKGGIVPRLLRAGCKTS